MEIKREPWKKSEVEKLIEYREIDELSWEEIDEKFPNRNIEAIRKKYIRCKDVGYTEDKRISKLPNFIKDEEKFEEFKKDYKIDKLTTNEIMKKYKIKSETMLFNIVREHNLHKNKRSKK